MVKRQRARRELSQPSIIKQDSYSPEFLSLSIATVAASPLLSTHQSCQSHCERMLQFLDCLKCSFSAADAGIIVESERETLRSLEAPSHIFPEDRPSEIAWLRGILLRCLGQACVVQTFYRISATLQEAHPAAPQWETVSGQYLRMLQG